MSRNSIAFSLMVMMVAISMCLIGAAAADREAPFPARYDASIVATTADLVVVDHNTQKMYVYGQHKGSWVLRSFTDLTQVGAVKLEPQGPAADEVDRALGREGG